MKTSFIVFCVISALAGVSLATDGKTVSVCKALKIKGDIATVEYTAVVFENQELGRLQYGVAITDKQRQLISRLDGDYDIEGNLVFDAPVTSMQPGFFERFTVDKGSVYAKWMLIKDFGPGTTKAFVCKADVF